jgi:hypothetical protein
MLDKLADTDVIDLAIRSGGAVSSACSSLGAGGGVRAAEAAVSVDAVEPQAARPMVMAAAIIRETAFFMSIPP